MVMLVIARKSLWMGITSAAIILGLFSPGPAGILREAASTLTDPSIIMLAVAMGMIPIIGGAMEKGGLMDDLVRNLPLRRKHLMAVSSALVGLLPMPGGALLSAPLLERGGREVDSDVKIAINVWYRHLFLLVYPLGMLLATTKMAGVSLYKTIFFLIPGFVIMLLLGNIFLLSKVHDGNARNRGVEPARTVVPVLVFVVAPLIHFAAMNLFPRWLPETGLIPGVLASILLAFRAGRLRAGELGVIIKRMRPWNFALIIVAMFLFLNIFKASETSRVIAEAPFSKDFLLIGAGFILGLATGRVQVPVSILLPIYLAQYGPRTMTPIIFAMMFFAVYQGYMISPIHPCVSVSLEYFRSGLKGFYRLAAVPALICLALVWMTALFILGI